MARVEKSDIQLWLYADGKVPDWSADDMALVKSAAAVWTDLVCRRHDYDSAARPRRTRYLAARVTTETTVVRPGCESDVDARSLCPTFGTESLIFARASLCHSLTPLA
jgi:hypothetical protein